jgi:hypothetical protein
MKARRLLPLLLSAFFGAAGSLSLVGCGEDFDPYNRLAGLRVLAIKAEPPAPAMGETTTLSALVFSEEADPNVSFAWTWCPLPGPANEGYPCLVQEAQIQEAASAVGMTVPPFDLGTGPTASLQHALSPIVLQAICTGTPGLPRLVDADCQGGFPVQIMLKVKAAGDEVISVRSVRLRFAPEHEPNANPFIEGLTVRLPDTEEDLPVMTTPEHTLPRAKETTVKATVPAAVSEPYTGLDENRQPAPTQEQLTLTWFVESGDTDDERTRFVHDGLRPQEAFENKWTPDRTKDYARDTARLIVVIRDDRGGIGWLPAAVKLGATP